MHGKKENDVLNRIKILLFCNDSQEPIMWNGKTAFDYSDEDYKENMYCCTKFENETIYGLTQDDIFEVANAIRKAKGNPNPSKFPDFVFENGFIEHFQITASKQSKKGSAEDADKEKFKREMQAEIDEFYKYCSENPVFNEVRSKQWIRKDLPEYSYKNLVDSFKTNFEKHIESLQKYKGCKDISIFLIQNSEDNIEMCENIGKNTREEIRCDYKIQQEHFFRYRLSRDKSMLKYLYTFKDKIDYVIYFYEENFEIIKVENIPELYKYIPNEYFMVPRDIQEIHQVANITTNFTLMRNNNN